MKVNVLVPVANGTEDVEASTVIDLLRRDGINVIVAGTDSPVTFARGIKVLPDVLIEDISPEEDFDAIILPGGMPGVNYLSEHKQLQHLLAKHISNNRITGAICAAPLILKENNHLKEGFNLTSFPSISGEFSEYNYKEEKVVVHKNFVTSRGLGTAIDFSLKIIELLLNKQTADKISKDIVYTN